MTVSPLMHCSTRSSSDPQCMPWYKIRPLSSMTTSVLLSVWTHVPCKSFNESSSHCEGLRAITRNARLAGLKSSRDKVLQTTSEKSDSEDDAGTMVEAWEMTLET